MDPLTIAAASGLRARMESLELLANNIANQSTPGFKMDRELYGMYASPEANPIFSSSMLEPVIESTWTDFSQGVLAGSGAPLEFALEGKGLFTVAGAGERLYTRNGNFRLSPAGVLQTQDGFPVLGTSGNPIQLDPAQDVQVLANGEIQQGGATVDQLAIAAMPVAGALSKHEGTYFRLTGSNTPMSPAAGIVVHQGKLELSNGSPAESAIRLVSIMRQFETLQKAIQIGGEMGKRGDDIARVGS